MNAYELADLIGFCGDGGYNQDAANMLRQQADRIAELQNNTCSACGQKVTEDLIHTCSPQLKPLSDDEIEKVFDNTFKVRDFEEAFLKFARAIEERHGIK